MYHIFIFNMACAPIKTSANCRIVEVHIVPLQTHCHWHSSTVALDHHLGVEYDSCQKARQGCACAPVFKLALQALIFLLFSSLLSC